MYELDEDKVCRAMAQMLLQNAVKFNLSEFQEVWQQSVPEGMSTRLDQLSVRGCTHLALICITFAVRCLIIVCLCLCGLGLSSGGLQLEARDHLTVAS